MTAVIQRVLGATVFADGVKSGEVGHGLMILLGVADGDSEADAKVMAEKIAKLRIFEDEAGKMNLSVCDIGGGALVVSNFTLLADYSHGNRPNYLGAAAPAKANELYEYFVSLLGPLLPRGVQTGVFGADMRVDICNDGPVTIVMDSEKLKK